MAFERTYSNHGRARRPRLYACSACTSRELSGARQALAGLFDGLFRAQQTCSGDEACWAGAFADVFADVFADGSAHVFTDVRVQRDGYIANSNEVRQFVMKV